MKIKKIVLVSSATLFGIFAILFGVLIYHIVTINPIESPNVQISRIDFKEPFDSLGTIEIKNRLHAIEGVKKEIIVKNNVVVYYHDNNIVDSKQVYEKLMGETTYDAERFVLPAAMANKQVCPVMKKDSYKYKFAQWVRKVFK